MNMSVGLASIYPPLGLELSARDLTMRLLRDDDLPAYAELLSSDVFSDTSVPYFFDWLNRDPVERLRSGVQWQWNARASISPAKWTLIFGVFEHGRLVGTQDVLATKFSTLRSVGSASFLRLDAQGHGVGTLMRQMMLVLAFDHLGARTADTEAIVGNAASIRVSEHCGYVANGTGVATNGDARVELARFIATPETFRRPDCDVVVTGLTDELRAMLGASVTGEATA